MNELTKPTFINQAGKPAFVVIPYADWLTLTKKKDEDVFFPHEVVSLIIEHSFTPIKAWRKYLKITQSQLAKHMGVSQANINTIENSANPRIETLIKVADALGIDIEQLSME